MAPARTADRVGGGLAAARRGQIPVAELVHYKVTNCHFGKNQNLAGSGTGATLGYVPIDAGFLDLAGTKVTNEPVPIEMNQRSRHYLHPVPGSEAAKVGAGLFSK